MANKNPYPKGSSKAAMWEMENSTNDYVNNGVEDYSWLGDVDLEELDYLPSQDETGLAGIQTDQRLNDMELQALSELEAQSKDGLSARDKADLAQVESSANRANAGRQGAIRQEMSSRGLGGSGLDFMARQQSAQDAYEMEALAGLEKAAMAQDGRRDATSRMGAMAGDMSSRQYAQKAAAAQAQDVINRFNTGNEIGRRQGNLDVRNNAAMYNSQGRQGVSNNSVGARNTHSTNANIARDKLYSNQFNYGVEEENRRRLEKQQKKEKRQGMQSAVLGTAGTVVGGYFGGPMGASVGGSLGSAAGQSFAHGGEVQGEAMMPGDHPLNDTVDANLSPGEVVIPRSISDDPDAAGEFVADVKGVPNTGADEAVEGLLAAMNYLSKKRR